MITLLGFTAIYYPSKHENLKFSNPSPKDLLCKLDESCIKHVNLVGFLLLGITLASMKIQNFLNPSPKDLLCKLDESSIKHVNLTS